MDRGNRRDDWTLIVAIALIAVGGWLLVEEVLGGFFPLAEIMRVAARVIWPLALIAAGLLIYFGARDTEKPPVAIAPAAGTSKRLYRSREDRMVGGVLGGLADYLGTDPTWIRIAYVIVALVSEVFPAVVLYVIAMIIIPEAPPVAATELQWPAQPPAPPAPPAAPAQDAPPAGEAGEPRPGSDEPAG